MYASFLDLLTMPLHDYQQQLGNARRQQSVQFDSWNHHQRLHYPSREQLFNDCNKFIKFVFDTLPLPYCKQSLHHEPQYQIHLVELLVEGMEWINHLHFQDHRKLQTWDPNLLPLWSFESWTNYSIHQRSHNDTLPTVIN